MTELPRVHVERDLRASRAIGESKCRIRIDEPTNEPGRGHAVDARTPSGYPATAVKARCTQCSPWRLPNRLTSVESPLQRGKRSSSLATGRSVEGVDTFDGAEPLVQRAKRAPGSSVPCRAQPWLGLSARHQPIDLGLERAVLSFTHAPNLRHDVLDSTLADRVGCEDGRFAAESDDLASNPLEILAALLGVRQHVYGIPGGHGAHLLPPPPRLPACVRRTSRQLMAQQKPAVISHVVTNVTPRERCRLNSA